jgi:hypothetical protein
MKSEDKREERSLAFQEAIDPSAERKRKEQEEGGGEERERSEEQVRR